MINKNRFVFLTRFSLIVMAGTLLLTCIAGAAPAVQDEDARRALQQTFAQLKSGQYDDLYNGLPATTRSRIGRARFTNELRRTREMYELDRMEIGALRVAGDFAAADTTIYGRVRRPVEGEGRILVRQYLVREDGRWRVVTDDRVRVRQQLGRNPQIARRFPYREPRAAVLRDGRWIELGSLNAMRRMTR